MQDVFSTPYTRARGSIADRDDLSRASLGFVSTLQSTIRVFERHPLAVFSCAVLLFASAGLLGSVVYATLIGESVLRTGSHTGAVTRVYNTQMLAQAVVGAFTFFLGRGAITWIALNARTSGTHTDGVSISTRSALKHSLHRWQPLLASSVFYGVLITLGSVGLTLLLRELRLDVSNARWLRGDLDSVLNWTLIRSLGALWPEPGSPFGEWLTAAKYNLSRSSSSSYFGFDYYSRYGAYDAPQSLWFLGALSGLSLVLFEALLCMRTAAVFNTAGRLNAQGAPASWLAESLRVSTRHLGRVMAWRWALRLATTCVIATTLVLLPALHQVTVMGGVRQLLGSGYWPYHIAQAGYGVASALIGGLLIAFGVAFEARMYLALSRR